MGMCAPWGCIALGDGWGRWWKGGWAMMTGVGWAPVDMAELSDD